MHVGLPDGQLQIVAGNKTGRNSSRKIVSAVFVVSRGLPVAVAIVGRRCRRLLRPSLLFVAGLEVDWWRRVKRKTRRGAPHTPKQQRKSDEAGAISRLQKTKPQAWTFTAPGEEGLRQFCQCI